MQKLLILIVYYNAETNIVQSRTFRGSALSLVRPAWVESNRCKSVKCPDSGKLIANEKGVYREVESEGSWMANLWSDGQKSHIRHGISGKVARQAKAQ